MADPDNSGVSNLMRHAFGLEGGDVAGGNMPWVETIHNGGQTFLRLHLRRSLLADDVELTLLTSSDLEIWNPIGPEWTVITEPDPILEDIERITALSPAMETLPGPVFLSIGIELSE